MNFYIMVKNFKEGYFDLVASMNHYEPRGDRQNAPKAQVSPRSLAFVKCAVHETTS